MPNLATVSDAFRDLATHARQRGHRAERERALWCVDGITAFLGRQMGVDPHAPCPPREGIRR